MAYKYTPLSGVGLCCGGRQDAVIQIWETQRRKKKEKNTVQIHVSFMFRGRWTCFHVGGWRTNSRDDPSVLRKLLYTPFTCEGNENLSCVLWSSDLLRVFLCGRAGRLVAYLLRGISETSSLKSHGCLCYPLLWRVWFGTGDLSYVSEKMGNIRKKWWSKEKKARYLLKGVPTVKREVHPLRKHGGGSLSIHVRKSQSWGRGRASSLLAILQKQFWHSNMRERSIQQRSRGPIAK